jgi:hypothetical protein
VLVLALLLQRMAVTVAVAVVVGSSGCGSSYNSGYTFGRFSRSRYKSSRCRPPRHWSYQLKYCPLAVTVGALQQQQQQQHRY